MRSRRFRTSRARTFTGTMFLIDAPARSRFGMGTVAWWTATFFSAKESADPGGVRVIGEDHRVVNNYFAGLQGDETRAALSFMNGVPNGELHEYAHVRRALIAFNTVVDCKVPMAIGISGMKTATLPPENCVIANNAFSVSKRPLIAPTGPMPGWQWIGNLQQNSEGAKPVAGVRAGGSAACGRAGWTDACRKIVGSGRPGPTSPQWICCSDDRYRRAAARRNAGCRVRRSDVGTGNGRMAERARRSVPRGSDRNLCLNPPDIVPAGLRGSQKLGSGSFHGGIAVSKACISGLFDLETPSRRLS